VIIDAEKIQEIQDQMDFMRKVALGLEDYRKGRTVPADDVVNKIDQISSRTSYL